jgi:ABC-type transporter Mla subunit MlaD
MTERYRNILIGVFVGGGVMAFGVLVLLFGAFPNVVSGGTYKVSIIFQAEVEDLPVDTDVFMLGKRVGRVVNVEWMGGKRTNDSQPALFSVSGVKAVIEVSKSLSIPSTAIATYKEAAIGFGRSRVQIKVPLDMPTQDLPRDGTATIEGHIIGSFEQIIPKEMGATLQKTASHVGNLAEALTPAAKDIHELLKPVTVEQVGNGEATGNLSSALQRMDAALGNINDVIGQPQVKQDLAVTIGNVRHASEQLKGAVADIQRFAASARQTAQQAEGLPNDIKGLLADVQVRFDSISRGLIGNSDNLNKVLVGLDTAIGKVNQGEGTLGHLVNDNRLYEALTLTAQRLSAVMADMQSLVKTWQEQGVRIESLKLR